MTTTEVQRPILRPSDATNLAGTETGRDHLSHSRIGILLACQRKFELTYEKRLERIDRGEARELGSAFQSAVEHRSPEHGFDLIMAKADSLVGGVHEFDALKVQATTVKAAAQLYLERWVKACAACEGGGDVAIGFDLNSEGPPFVETCPLCHGTGWDQSERREMEYRVQLRSPWTGAYSRTFDLLGYADGVTEQHLPHTGAALSLTENKLVGRITSAQVQKLVLDRQVTLACYGLWRATGLPVTEVRYRYVKKPSIKQTQKESVDQFLARLEADYAERPDFYAHEETLYRTTEDLLRVECELWIWGDMVRRMRRQKLYTRNTASCDMWGGCDFIALCSGEPDAMSLYREREAHPA